MNVTRRFFLQSSLGVAAYTAITPWRLLAESGFDAAQIQPVRRNRTLVVIFLRGGMDGLNFIVPYGDPAYAPLRKNIGVAAPGLPNGALDLDGFFGLHPKAAALMSLFRSGDAAALQAVGYAENTRSHFEEQDMWETGLSGNTIHSDGWLNRHLATSSGHGPLRAVAIGDSLPRILRGDAPAYAFRGMTELAPTGDPNRLARTAAALEHAYCSQPSDERRAVADAHDLLAQSARTTLEATELLRKATSSAYAAAVDYPKTELGRKLEDAARLIKLGLGIEVIELDFAGWDTHQNQGSVEGNYAKLVQTLAESVSAFTRDLGDRMNNVLLLTLSDFGRTAAENGTGGTDHGWANCMLAVGAGVRASGGAGDRGPRIVTRWPGLAREQLHQRRDLQHTTDFRDVLGEVVSLHLENPHLQTVLPKHTFTDVGLLGHPS